ncbi:diguanylate cyclase [Pseudothermotoga sp.]|nr:diguanylate cyclase [Pseudothermotoga sp.]MDW8140399.1 diguanylate cyclase [Pseudothermotoga sp.]
MRLVRFLRQTYSGDEFLVVADDVYKRLKVIKKEAVGDRKEELADFLAKLSRLKHPAVVPIEGSDFRSELPQVYFAYYGGEQVNLTDPNEKEEFAKFLLRLLREFVHHGIVIPVLSLQDFLKKEDYYMLPPCWRNPKQLPEDSSVFVAPEFARYGVANVASTAYVFGRMILSLSKSESVADIVTKFVQEDPSERKLHFVMTTNLLNGLTERVRIRPVVLAREQEERILQLVDERKPKLNTILVYGPQRSGKTTLLSTVADRLRHMGIPSVWLTSVEILVTDLVQLLSDEIYSSLDEETKMNIDKFMASKELTSDEVILTVAKILNKMETIALIVDDAHELQASLKTLIKNLSEYVYPKGHILLLSCLHSDVDLPIDAKLELTALNFKETSRLVSQSLAIDEKSIPIEFLNWLHTVTQGLAGKIVEVIKILAKENRLSIVENRLYVNESMLPPNLDQILDLSVEKYKKSSAALLALCGEKFTLEEVKVLGESLASDSKSFSESLRQMMRDGLIYFENDRFRFTLPEIWHSLYENVEKSIRERTHQFMSMKISSQEKRAWHLRMLGKTASAAALYLLAARREISSYGDISAAIDYLSRAKELTRDRVSYAWVSLNFKALAIKGEAKRLKSFAEMLSGDKRFVFFRYAALVLAGELSEAIKLEGQIDFDGKTVYSRLFRISYMIRRKLRTGERVEQKLVKELSILVSSLGDSPLHKKLKASALMLLAHIRGIDSIQALEILNNAKTLAETGSFYDVLAEVLLLLGTRLTATPEAQRLFEQVVEIANKIGSQDLAMNALSNLMWTSLYKAEVGKMFQVMHRLRHLAMMTGNAATEAYTYFVESQYHTYNKQLHEALEDLEKERTIERQIGIEERSLRAIVAAYALCGQLEKAKQLVIENKDNPALNNLTFVEFRDLILAEDDEQLLQAWKKFVSKEHLYWMEEACQAFGEKIVLLDRESFFNFAEKLEKEEIKSGAFLSLAQVFEGMALAYKALKEDLMALNYAERAITIYRTHGFDSAANWLENKLGMSSQLTKLMRLIQVATVSEEESKNIIKDLQVIASNFIDAYAVSQYALDTLKVVDPQDELKSILDFLLSRMMNMLPVSSASLALLDGSGRVVEVCSFNVSSVPKKPVLSYEPFEVHRIAQLPYNYKLSIYLANKSLYVSKAYGESLMRIVLNLQEVSVHILKNAIFYRRSITDPLTGLYTRWYFMHRLREEFERVKRYGGNFSVVMADIDDFKKINDTYGHKIGDEVLKFISSLMKSYTRVTDIIGRYGGEEFIIILPNTDKESAARACQKILYGMVEMNPFEFRVTMSFGVSGYPEDTVFEPDELIVLADKAMYISKERGKACVTVYG